MASYVRILSAFVIWSVVALTQSVLLGQDKEKDTKEKETKKRSFAPKTWTQVVDAGAEFLKKTQAEDGTWSRQANPGVTAVALTGLLQTGKTSALEPASQKALKYIVSQVDPKEGHIALPIDGGKGFQKNYVTAVNVKALCAIGAERSKYDTIIKNAVTYLRKSPWSEENGKKPDDPYFGGVGYGPGTRPDMSNSHYLLDALNSGGGVPKNDPLYKNMLVFVSRCQNLKSEHNDQPWAGAINDGSFIYVLGAPKNKDVPENAPRPGYGSMTYAGLKSFADCGLSKEDPRYKKAWEWITKNYSVDVNPGFAPGNGPKGYYYYLSTMANCLDTLGVDTVVDDRGVKHDWRAEILLALANHQNKDGSWSNTVPNWMESNPDLCTGYALIALNFAKPKNP